MFPKVAKEKEVSTVEIASCPICHSFCQHMYFMQDAKSGKKSKWHSCACGVIFQKDKPKGHYGLEYLTEHIEASQKYKDSAQYPIRLYLPLIEELIYGRKCLVVGTPTFHQVDALRDRGWVTHSIDKNEALSTSNRHTVGDFETHEFKDSFNLIWMYHTLECFTDPSAALRKCFTLMPEDGILFIATPDTDFVYTRASSAFNHWKEDMNNIMWNKRSLVSHLEKLGFDTHMARRNYEHRFPAIDDIHLIAQKKFF